MDVVVVVRQREGRSSQPEQRDHLLRLHLSRKTKDVPHPVLGRPARVLVTSDRLSAERGDVYGESIDVRRNDAGPRIKPVTGAQTRDGHGSVPLQSNAIVHLSDAVAKVAKRIDLPYQAGNRDGMQKIKKFRSADCVVGGFRYGTNSREVGSLLLGLYDSAGRLDHVGWLEQRDRQYTITQRDRLELGTDVQLREDGSDLCPDCRHAHDEGRRRL